MDPSSAQLTGLQWNCLTISTWKNPMHLLHQMQTLACPSCLLFTASRESKLPFLFFFCNIGFPCGPVHRLPLHHPPSVAHLLLLPRLTPASRISTSILLPTRVSVFLILLKLTLSNSFRIASSVCNRQLSSSPPSPTELGCRRQKPMLRRRSLRCNQLNFALFSTWRH